ncbi:MAG: MBL fold metallo-hydrolase [Pseudomonadota bacterium]
MLKSPMISRRGLLKTAATAPLLAAAGPLAAGAPMLGASSAVHRRETLGAFEVTTILAGTALRENPKALFGTNVDDATFEAASQAANIPTDVNRFFYTPTVVNTGSELVLLDTGLSGAGTVAALAQAGYTPEQIDVVVITHMHGDHIGGLLTDGAPTFPNARYVTTAIEFDFWANADNERFEGNVRPIADQFAMIRSGDSVASGITAMAAHGHTPGHTAYMVESEGKMLAICADFAAHPIWSIANPDWEFRFDADKAEAAATRRRLLDMMATDGIPFVGYHMPFPAIGFIETAGSGFRYVPHSYQLTL